MGALVRAGQQRGGSRLGLLQDGGRDVSIQLHHEMIKASAGSGKTYTLVTRYLKLLALGVAPSRITALTFTRKAAGEFLNGIFLRLTEAASSEKAAARLAQDLKLPDRNAVFFRSLLATLVGEIGRLQLGTIDQFFGRIVGAFPFELGLARSHRIMDEFEQDLARERTLRQIMESADDDMERFVLQVYKNLTWGNEDKNVYGVFESKLGNCHQAFIEIGDGRKWGNEKLIFPGIPWWADSPDDLDRVFRDIESALENAGLKKGVENAIRKLLLQMQDWQPGQDPKGGAILDRLLEVRDQLPLGDVAIKFGRWVADIPPSLGRPLHALLRHFICAEIKHSLLQTRTFGQFLEAYDALYGQLVRETGSLVFADLPMLLAGAFSRDSTILTSEDLLYRLDARADHWLLDEFQDTSRIQWKVLGNFIDEVVQDPGGDRTFFYVGDVKQSIYAWRGGDPRLFEEVFNYYQGAGSGIQQDFLNTSWRSAPPVLDCVNRMFREGLRKAPLPAPVKDRWQQNWQDHVASEKMAAAAGYAAWGLVGEKTSLEEACIELIREVDPLDKGLSCAVLVRDNKAVDLITQALRTSGIPASMEGRAYIVMDNVVGAWIRAFLYHMARPGKPFFRHYLEMAGMSMEERAFRDLVHSARVALTDEGYAEAIRWIVAAMPDHILSQPFLQRRIEQILEAAARFRGTGKDSLEQFISYLEKVTTEESTLRSQIQVMTVHKAKGLGFDMVVVAGFGEAELIRSQGKKTLHTQRDRSGEVEWTLEMPRKQIMEADTALKAAGEGARNDALYEALCLLYVAMTRARQGLYCIAVPNTKGGELLRWHHLFEAAFDGSDTEDPDVPIAWQCSWGEASWHTGIQKPATEPERIELLKLPGPLPETPVFLRLEASPSNEAHRKGRGIRPLGSARGKRFGTRMHHLLASLEWIHFTDERSVGALIDSVDEDLRPRLAEFLKKPLAREVFGRPDRPCVVWREKPYAIRKGDLLTQGIIDRALVFTDASGQPVEIQVLDFKTDQLDPGVPAEMQLEERYSKQLDRYIEAVRILTGLPEGKVSARLIPI